MPVYLCRWPNGDFSIVKAAHKDEAIEFLDEVGNAEGCPVTAIRDFMVHFILTDDGEFELETYGEITQEHIMRAYPLLSDAFSSVYGSGVSTEEGQKAIREAVNKERERVSPKRVKEPKTARGREIKAMMDVPTSKVNRIVEREAKEVLKKFKGKGNPN
jgi:hypothetical protein